MNPRRLLLILRAHYKAALGVAFVTLAVALAALLTLPKRYTATTSLIFDARSPDPVAALILPATLGTQVEVISSARVALRVVKELGLVDNPTSKERWLAAAGGKVALEPWLADRLLAGLTVAPSRDGNIIVVSYSTSDGASAAAIANAFAQAYIDTTIDLKVEPARQYALWFKERGNVLRDNLAKAQATLSAFQRENGILSSKDDQPDGEMAQLNELTAQLVKVQSEANDARSKQRSGAAGDSLPEVTESPVVAELRGEVAKQEARLQETAVNLGVNHPQYLRMQSALAALKQRLGAETRRVTNGFSATRNVGNDRASVLKAAIDAQKEKMLNSRVDRDQLTVLQRDVDAAKNAYDTVAKRYTETELASQTTQANVSVLTPALVPLEPSFPKPLAKSLAMAIGLSVLLGFATALLLEMIDRRIRSVDDVAEALLLPVLGVIARQKPSSGRLLGYARRSPALTAK